MTEQTDRLVQRYGGRRAVLDRPASQFDGWYIAYPLLEELIERVQAIRDRELKPAAIERYERVLTTFAAARDAWVEVLKN